MCVCVPPIANLLNSQMRARCRDCTKDHWKIILIASIVAFFVLVSARQGFTGGGGGGGGWELRGRGWSGDLFDKSSALN